MDIFFRVMANYPYFVAMVLFCIGIYAILSRANLMKKIIGINIMINAIFLLLISSGNIRGGIAPLQAVELTPEQLYVNPLPAALVLTGIVVSLSVTAFALSIVIKINDYYGTIEVNEILEIRSRQ
ncbi:MAG: NADH-quinone oxidoreductase subunit K [Dethiobacter sp.]|nr:NADH-quinone oxidoreductase subunit K [Dethiobacter sp.]MBS3897411.1 NADH-quinone oxidoreductase subunit K [Dethiobacter sp.]MBS3982265.1 NADH-quinone oxidoreductase subunit K [Dethiobacter sp.]MCL5992658.1 sodium:proton antiporter [Bacillota bacterium]